MPYRPIYSTLLDKPTVKKTKTKGISFSYVAILFLVLARPGEHLFNQPA